MALKLKMKFLKDSSMSLVIYLVTYFKMVLSESEVSEYYPGISECIKPGLVALTFDDGPSPNGGTQNVLNVLREEQAKATFFVTARGHDLSFLDSDKQKESLLQKIFADGHQIGSHTWSHSNLIQNHTKDQLYQELFRLATTVHSILGINMTVLRPPYGLTNDTVVNFIQQEFGYQVVRWNLDTMDWYHRKNITASFKPYEDTLDSAKSSTTSFITLHHDPVLRSGELARKAVRFVRSKGFKLVTVGECIGVPDFL